MKLKTKNFEQLTADVNKSGIRWLIIWMINYNIYNQVNALVETVQGIPENNSQNIDKLSSDMNSVVQKVCIEKFEKFFSGLENKIIKICGEIQSHLNNTLIGYKNNSVNDM